MITPATDSSFPQNSRQVADNLAHSGGKSIDAARTQSNQLLDSAEDKLDSLHSKAAPALEKLSNKAQELAQRGMDMASNTKDQAKESLSHYSEVTTRYVAEKPIQSILIAAAVGAGLALLMSSSGRRYYR